MVQSIVFAIGTIFTIAFSRFHTDPSGTFVRYEAKAVGSGSEAAQSELQDKWHSVCLIKSAPYLKLIHDPTKQITLKEAHILTLRVLKQVMEEKLDQHNVQLAQVSTNLSSLCFNILTVLPLAGHASRRL